MANNATDLVLLAEVCLQAAKTISGCLEKSNCGRLGFDAHALPKFPECDKETQSAREALRDASKAMYDLATGPVQFLTESSILSLQWINSMRYICHFNVPDAVPDRGEIDYQTLAQRCGLDSSQLKQNVRFAATNRVFCETRPGYVAHTIASLQLKEENPVRSSIQWLTEDCAPMVAHHIDAIEKWGHGSSEPNQTAVNYAYDFEGPFYQFIPADEVREKRFGVIIRQVIQQPTSSVKHIQAGFKWDLLGNGTVVDVGGHIGDCAVAIAEAAPKLNLIVQDRPEVVAMAEDPKTTVVPKELRSRVTFEAHDFFQPQKTAADAFFYRKIFLNHSDKYAAQIIGALSPVLKSGNRLLIMDFIQTDGPISDTTFERYYRAVDLQMLLYYNSRYRTLNEWKELVSAGDPRLIFESWCTPPGSCMPIMSFIVD